MILSDRAKRIAPSATMAASAKAKELQRAGVDVILLDAGEPDFPTVPAGKEAALAAIHDNFTKYTPLGGILELRQAIAMRLLVDDGLTYAPEQIVVGVGAKEVLYLACQVLLQAGDEAIIPSPYWVSYAEQVRLADATPILVQTTEESGFKLLPDALEASITPNTRMLIINSPSNPTGSVYTAPELRALGEVLAKHPDVAVVSDEIYKKIAYNEDGCAPSAAAILSAQSPALAERIILVDGASKAYSMTGWRVGFVAAAPAVITAIRNLQSHSSSGTASISQKAAAAAFSADQAPVEHMRQAFQERRDVIVLGLNSIAGISCPVPDGAFYAYANVTGLLDRTYRGRHVTTSLELAAYFLQTAHVSVVPGEAFGTPGYLRLSYATSMDNITSALARLKESLEGEEPARPLSAGQI